MILVFAVLGHELFRVELATPQPEVSGDDHELTSVHRHAGDFGFGPSPVRPYWTPEPGEAPDVP